MFLKYNFSYVKKGTLFEIKQKFLLFSRDLLAVFNFILHLLYISWNLKDELKDNEVDLSTWYRMLAKKTIASWILLKFFHLCGFGLLI